MCDWPKARGFPRHGHKGVRQLRVTEKTQVDGRDPSHLDTPVLGRFENGVGKFYAEDTFKGKPIRVRYVWTQTSGMPHWEQAFSSDAGASWETNWTMDFAKAK